MYRPFGAYVVSQVVTKNTDMITVEQRQEIIQALEAERTLLGSWKKVATKCGVNEAVVHTYIRREEEWSKVSEQMWVKVAAAIGYEFSSKRNWVRVNTNNANLMNFTLKTAQERAMCLAISSISGSAKSSGIAAYKKQDQRSSVFVLECREWARGMFLRKLSQVLGIASKERITVEAMGDAVIARFRVLAKSKASPMLILDEADKLRPSALRFLIPFYNELEGVVSIVLCGTENLEKEIKNNARKAVKGYDEIDSRLGRSYIPLPGANKAEVEAIARANGITNAAAIDRIWTDAKPAMKTFNGKYSEVVEEIRHVRRLVERELMMEEFSQLSNHIDA